MNKECWSIWDARVYFEDDPEKSKIRPVVVLGEDTYYCMSLSVTSKSKDRFYAYKLVDWEKAGLDRESYVKLEQFEIDQNDFTSFIGNLQNIDIVGLQDALLYKYR